jgi:hypothetical protein
MQYLGDYTEDFADLNLKFHTHKADGTPIVLGGTPAISVYKSNSATQSTAGITLSTDFDSVVGLNNVKIDLSADAFYAVGNDYQVVITTGTVDSVSVVGTVVASFSIENRFLEASLADGAITATKIANDAITAAKIANDAITAAKIADNAISDQAVSSVTGAVGSVTGAVGSVTGAVGSVTGNVGGNVVGSVGSVTGAVGSVTGSVGSVASYGSLVADIWNSLTSGMTTVC